MVRFDSSGGWCGNVPRPGHNWVQIDLRAPTVIRGFRIQVVVRSDGAMAYPVSLRIHFTDDLTDAFHVYSDPSGRVCIILMYNFQDLCFNEIRNAYVYQLHFYVSDS